MRRIPLPAQVADIYKAVSALEMKYGRKFTPDGHLVGSIGEVIAKEAFDLELYPMSHSGHDARDRQGRDVQIKLTSRNCVALYANCDRLIVMRIVSPEEAEVIYDGDGDPVWAAARKPQKNGQRQLSISTLRKLSGVSQGNSTIYPVVETARPMLECDSWKES